MARAITSEEYLEEAREYTEAADHWASQGDLARCSDFRFSAIVNLLKFAVRRKDGWDALRGTNARACIDAACDVPIIAHPTDVLDAAHVALLLDRAEIAVRWLRWASAAQQFSEFWAQYSRELVELLEQRRIESKPIILEKSGQSV